MKYKKLLVTGAGGFIGSHLVEELLNRGYEVRAFIRYYSSGQIGNLRYLDQEKLKKIEIIRGDLKDYDSVLRAVKGVDGILHLGALVSIPYSYVDPRDFVETNIIGTLNVLRAAQMNNIKKIVITSTSETYGTALYSPMDENHPTQAQSPYAASKISADKIALSFVKSFNLPVAIIRPFNTIGPRQSMRAVVPSIIYQALFKDKVRIGSLEPERDFLFVSDTVDGFIKILESDRTVGEIINIGSGKTISIGNLIKLVEELLNKKLVIEIDQSRIRPKKSEVYRLLADIKKAKQLTGWEPKISIEEALKKIIKFVKQNPGVFKEENGNI